MAVTCLVEAKIKDPEPVCVPAHDLFDRVRALPDGDIVLETTKGKLTLKSGARKLSVSTLAVDEYPPMKDPEGTPLSVPAEKLATAVKATVYAVNDDSARVGLHSLRIALSGGNLTLAGTDGHRLAEWSAPAESEGEFVALVPKPSALLLKSVLDGAEGNAQVTVSGAMVFVTLGSVTFAAVTVEPSAFPPIQHIIPDAKRSEVEIMTAVAAESMRALAIVAGKTGNISLAASGGKIRASVESPDHGESSDEFQAVGDSFDTIKSNVRYLIEAVSSLGSETATIDCGASLEPILIKGGHVRAVVMPVR